MAYACILSMRARARWSSCSTASHSLGTLWRYQIKVLTAAGYRVVAPDQRGYGQSDAPTNVDEYDATHLVGDVVDLVDALGEQSAILVGQDLGGAVRNAVRNRLIYWRKPLLSRRARRQVKTPIALNLRFGWACRVSTKGTHAIIKAGPSSLNRSPSQVRACRIRAFRSPGFHADVARDDIR
jgi:alpha/beta hydrolase fold